MKKRGQLTIFIILAIVIVIVLVLFFYFRDSFFEERYDPKVELLRANVINCFNSNFAESLIIIGIQGGYLDVPEPKEIVVGYFFSFDFPYYYYEGGLNIPTIERIEREIGNFAKGSLIFCFEEYEDIEGYEFVEFSGSEVSVEINEEYVSFTPSVFMDVGYDGKTARVDFSRTPVNVISDLYGMHRIASFIAEYYKNNNEWTPFSEIVDLANKHDLYANVLDSEDGYENSIEISSRREGYYPERFIFKNKFSHDNLGEIEPLL